MKFGVPWRAKGIRADARETAKEAARRAGMSLDDWLNSVMMQQATQAGMPPYGAQPQAAQPDPQVNNRLDEISRRIDQLNRSGAADYTLRRRTQSEGPDRRAELIGQLDQYVHDAQPAALDQALADIAARQRMLNDSAPPPRQAPAHAPAQLQVQAHAPPAPRAQAQAAAQAPAPAPLPAQDLSRLEEQLRKITDQIETLRQPKVEEAINALRAELGEIGHALGEAMPQLSLEAIERQIQGLSLRIAEGRENGVDHNALAGIEQGLGEVRDALHGLTPAENLVGFNDAVEGLAQKIDLIVAQKDPETMAQLENAITTLRDMAGHIASNDAVSALAAEVQCLADKVDHIAQASANADALSSLEHRIDALGQALEERALSGSAVPPRMEALVQSLSDKIEQIQAAQQVHGDDMTEGHVLDDRIAMLVDRLDASDSRVGQLEAIEHALSDLLAHMQQSQAGGDTRAGEAAAVDTLKYDFAQARNELKDVLKYDIAQSQQALKYDLAQAQDELKNDLALSQDELKGDIARTQDALNEVHGTLGELVQRLAAIEQSIRNEPRAAAPMQIETPAPTPVPAEENEPLELTQPGGRAAGRLVDGAPGISAFDDMPPSHSARPAEPIQPVAPEPALVPPPMEPAPMAESEVAAFEGEEQTYPSLPPALQLEAQLQASRAHAASKARAPQAEVPPFEEPGDEALPPPAPQAWASDAPAPKRMAPGHGPINPNPPPDEPLEPGSGPPSLCANPAARIAASEAALGHMRGGADAPAGGKSNFIAAARRAAQAAMQHEAAARPPKAAYEGAAEETDAPSTRKRMKRRFKSLFVAASIVALVGSTQIAVTMLNLGKSGAPTRTPKQHLSMDRPADSEPAPASRQAASAVATIQSPVRIASTPLTTTKPTASIDLLAPPDQTVHIANVPAPNPRGAARAAASPAQGATATDITGSIPEAAEHSTLKPTIQALSHSADLPIEIGGPRLRRAATAGDGAAAYEVAMRFAEGRGVPANLSKAARWYERAANKGLAPAQFRLARLLEKGQGVKKDLPRARALYFSAARQGNAKAMHNLAVLYAEGIDGKPDYTTAVQWFDDAAKHGVSDSQYNLGILYARGIGVEKNLLKSYKWFALAAKHGDKEAAKKRDEVATRMDAKALTAARRAVATFVPTPQPKQATAVPAPAGGWDKATAAPPHA